MTTKRKYDLIEHEVVGAQIARFVLDSPEPFDFLPGQYLELEVDGINMLCSIASTTHPLEFHLRSGANHPLASRFINALLKTKTCHASVPKGLCTLQDDSKPYVFVAGGTGISPFKALIDQALEMRLQAPITLYWGVSSLEDIYLDAWLKDIESRGVNVVIVLSGDQAWDGSRGLVHEHVLNSHPDLMDARVYACGPYPMIHTFKTHLKDHGFEMSHFYSDMG